MGMSTNVVGVKPPDARWQEMKVIWDACRAAGIRPPVEVEQFFDRCPPDPAGVVVGREKLEACGAVREWRDDTREGYEIDVSKLPPDVTVVRFYNSW